MNFVKEVKNFKDLKKWMRRSHDIESNLKFKLCIQVCSNLLSLFSNYFAWPLTHANNAQMILKRRMVISRQILHVDPLLYSKKCLYK